MSRAVSVSRIFAVRAMSSAALVNLPTGDVVDVTVNGEPVRVSGRQLSLPFSAGAVSPALTGIPESTSVQFVPNGRNGAMLSAVKRAGPAFVAGEIGTRDDFFRVS